MASYQSNHFMQYMDKINHAYISNSRTIIHNYTENGYHYIFNSLINNANYNIYILAKDYDHIFPNHNSFDLFITKL